MAAQAEEQLHTVADAIDSLICDFQWLKSLIELQEMF
jgi:hypothetical protein